MLVSERRQRAAAKARLDEGGNVPALLFGRGRNARHRIAVGAGNRDGVANGKHIGMARHRQVRLHL